MGNFPRDEISDEKAARTVDSDTFKQWLKERVCPFLDDDSKDEANIIVIMDNTSTHMSHKVRAMITQPHTPDLSPIEYGFHIYKSHVKRHSKGVEFH